ncbi:response regulator [Pleionea sediminis]|uniref:response regulator n=1 Tax=Pleionea sediminis TaxID=2569479 RepID=UPI001185D841|nr:response regulator [Pleionea sediminis]
MSAFDEKPTLVYRYDNQIDRDWFLEQFSLDFTIHFCTDDEQALQLIDTSTNYCCLFLDYDNTDNLLQSPLLNATSTQSSLPIFIMGKSININTIEQLLRHHNIKKCYSAPYDLGRIRSDVYEAKFNLSSTSVVNRHCEPLTNPGVLIVDDEILATKYLVKQLQEREPDIPFLTASSAVEALAQLREVNHDIAVVISDQRMPGMKGDELLKEIRKANPNIIRVLTSAYQDVDVALSAINEGQIYQYLKKPWQADAVQTLIRDALSLYERECEQNKQQQDKAVTAYQIIYQTRLERLSTCIGQLIDEFCESEVFEQCHRFFKQIQTDSTLRNIQSAVRASENTSLENQLIEEITTQVKTIISLLTPLKTMSQTQIKQLMSDLVNEASIHFLPSHHQTSELRQLQSKLSEERITEEQSFSLNESHNAIIRKALTIFQILSAQSDSHTTSFSPLSQQGSFGLSTNTENPIRCYKGLFDPITQVSKPFIEYQTAVIFLIILKSLTNNIIELIPDTGSFRLNIRLPKDDDSGKQPL